MSEKNFGKIISSIRKEYKNTFDEPMTQQDLADEANIPLVTLQKIEQGRQANLKTEQVLRLANALHIPSYALLNFLLASLDFEQYTNLNLPSVEDVREQILAQLESLQSPSILMTVFGDILSISPVLLTIFGFDQTKFESSRLFGRPNFYRFLFGPEFDPLYERSGENFSTLVTRRILQFKSETLRFRNHWYYRKIIPELNTLPRFRQFWQSSYIQYQDYPIILSPLTTQHPRWENLEFCPTPFIINTLPIPLVVNVFEPCGRHTVEACLQMVEASGTRLIKLNSDALPPAGNGTRAGNTS